MKKFEFFSYGLVNGFGQKNCHVLLFGKISRENVFGVILERKKVVLDCEKKEFKKTYNWDFSNGIFQMGFGIGIFSMDLVKKLKLSSFSLRRNRPGKCVWQYSKKQQAFLDYKNKKYRNRKFGIFFNGVSPWFLVKELKIFNFFG